MNERFTADELYVIERDADLSSSGASKNIFKLAEQILHLGVFIKDDEKTKKELGKILMAEIQEHHKSADIYRKIRNKCEYLRTK